MLQSYNTIIHQSATPENKKQCNCRNKELCPLNGTCISNSSVVYQVAVKADQTYIG